MRPAWPIALFGLALAGCSHSSLTLLSNEDGGHGAVALLEANGRPPEFDVRSDPNKAMEGRDEQIEVAVRELMRKVGKS